ncbi:MAG: hypothetical protein SGJ13_06425 [Actinomycetota bacterium]|nr:hypothetical protein [Actinomycetota bacterium]
MNSDHGARFRIALVIGGAVMAYGIWGVLDDARATHPGSLFVYVVGADLVHDLVIAPVVCIVGWLLTRVVPEPWRSPARAAVLISAIAVVVGWPSLRGYGRARVPDNASVQPLDYSTALGTVLAVVWLGTAVWATVRVTRRRSNEDAGNA